MKCKITKRSTNEEVGHLGMLGMPGRWNVEGKCKVSVRKRQSKGEGENHGSGSDTRLDVRGMRGSSDRGSLGDVLDRTGDVGELLPVVRVEQFLQTASKEHDGLVTDGI